MIEENRETFFFYFKRQLPIVINFFNMWQYIIHINIIITINFTMLFPS